MKTFYIIEVETRLHEKIQYWRTSSEGYSTYEAAKEFVLSRADKPEQITDYRFKSNRLIYSIKPITIKE